MTDENGEVVYRFEYNAYGELVSGETGKVMFMYNGCYGVVTDENGLYFMRARYYNVDIKRFINQDVLTGSIEDSATLNRYSYVEGNPVSFIDPFGLCSASGFGHAALNLLGMLPVVGIAADAVNAVWYLAEGDFVNAALSSISLIPYAGQVVATSRLVKTASTAAKITKYSKIIGTIMQATGNAAQAGTRIYVRCTQEGANVWKELFSTQTLLDVATIGMSAISIGISVKGLKSDLAIEIPETKTVKNTKSTEIVSYYPPNNGAIIGSEKNIYLMPGDKIDRYGKVNGKYFSPIGTPVEMRSLPYDVDLTQYKQFEVVKPFEVEASTIAPAFDKVGLGTQYRSSVTGSVLLKHGIIKVLGE